MADLGLRDLLPIPLNVPEGSNLLAPPEWDVPAAERGQLKLFVLIGQSNMSGRGGLESSNAPRPHPSVYMFNKDYRWYPAREPLGTMAAEVDWVARDGGTGVGPGLAFARYLLDTDPSLKIGLVPCARGTSSIEDWQPDISQNSLYGSCLKRTFAASTYGEVAGILILQGEDDTMDPMSHPDRALSAATWGMKFGALVKGLRFDLGQPDLPVIFAQIGQLDGSTELPNWETVRAQQAGVSLPGVAMITTDDLFLQSDAHFTTEGQVEIGRRFAAAYRAILDEQP